MKSNILLIQGSLLSLRYIYEKEEYKALIDQESNEVIKIYATNKIFLDRDLELKGVSLVIIAPNWEVVGDGRVIDLSGKDAQDHNPVKASNGDLIKTDEANKCGVNEYGAGINGNKGTDGKPGKPGGSGGNFLGIGGKYNNLEYLTIKVSGGKGGKGQDGGDGSNGNHGDLNLVKGRNKFASEFTRKELGFADKEGINWAIHGVKKLATFNSQFLETYTSKGMAGGKGGDAGKGGACGKGGFPGNVI